jgi:hypothetical protein
MDNDNLFIWMRQPPMYGAAWSYLDFQYASLLWDTIYHSNSIQDVVSYMRVASEWVKRNTTVTESNYVINATNLIQTSLPLYWGSMSRHVSGITCPCSEGTAWTHIWRLLCAVADVRSLPTSWDQPISTTAHNSHQICIRVVTLEDR